MPELGDSKKKYCKTCGRETRQVYTAVKKSDPVFGIPTLINKLTNNDEANYYWFWRCTSH